MYVIIFLFISELLIFLSIMVISGVLADEQIPHGNLLFSGLFAILIAYIIPYFFVKTKKYIGLCIYGIFVSTIGIVIMYYDFILIATRGFHAFGNPVIYMLIVAGISIASTAIYMWHTHRNPHLK